MGTTQFDKCVDSPATEDRVPSTRQHQSWSLRFDFGGIACILPAVRVKKPSGVPNGSTYFSSRKSFVSFACGWRHSTNHRSCHTPFLTSSFTQPVLSAVDCRRVASVEARTLNMPSSKKRCASSCMSSFCPVNSSSNAIVQPRYSTSLSAAKTILGLYPGPAYLVPSTRNTSSEIFRLDFGAPTW